VTRRQVRRIAINALGVLTIFAFAFPVYWMASTAFKQPGDIQTYVPKFLPFPPTLDNFTTAVNRPFFPDYLRNSLVISISTVLLALVVGLMAAMAVARARFRGRKSFLLLVVVAQMAPFEALLIPMYLVLRQANLLNQIPALILTYFIFTLPFTIWALRGFIAGIPAELEEFLYAYVLMRDTANFTLPVWLATFRTAFGTDWGGTMAASTLFTLPVLVFFLLIQNRMVGGVTAGAVKG
jgi:N,N'-diacetylchitobiose transport system permease protein